GNTNGMPTVMSLPPDGAPVVAVPKAEGVMSVYRWAGAGHEAAVSQYRFDAARTGVYRPPMPETGIALAEIDFGRFHAGGNEFTVTVDNPNALPISLTLSVQRGEQLLTERRFDGGETALLGSVAYTVPDAAPAAFVFVAEVTHDGAVV